MSFELGIPVSRPLEEQLIATLREYNPALSKFSGEEIVRQVEPAEVLGALGSLRRIPVLHQIASLVDLDLVEGFDRESLRREKTVPLQLSEDYLTVAIANPYGNYKLIYERRYPNLPIVPVLTSAAQINGLLSRGGRIQQITRDEIRKLEGDDAGEELRDFDLNQPADDSVVRNLQSIVQEGITRQASDIHLLTEKERFHFTLRLEGDLIERRDLDLKLVGRTDNFLTQLMGFETMDKNRGLPLSGRFTARMGDRRIAIRAERLPSYRGFHYTLRILDKSHVSAKLGQGSLALHPATMKYIKQALNLPDGMILMSGPTGSGKSTTLVAMVKELFRTRYNIISIENPVEEEVPMVTHVNLEDVKHGPLFIRSGMRSDPDILLVGEIRDRETAELGIEAALTGHQVLSTIHTTWPAQIIIRLMQLGVPKFYVAETLKAACGQRLAKKLCKYCKEPMLLTDQMVDELGLPDVFCGHSTYRAGSGCVHCNQLGYAGRQAMIEVLPITDEVTELIMRRDLTSIEIANFIYDQYHVPSLRSLAFELLYQGIIDLPSAADSVRLGLISERDKKWQPT
ncbi:MAG TPA: ATPase, T2SS/T4P/T4SS family [Chthoniobacterales bacterium]|jgi:type II secretory ATPase GspE/PulE/Tfp pilus assembly ATPase PilB-like protein|nr:ATPase, T2SS/T4P/T4SS family [Chthoniobacterales bacterium]